MKAEQFKSAIEEHIKNGTLKDWAGKFQEIVTPEKLDQFRANNKLEKAIKDHLMSGDFKEWIGKFIEIATPKKLQDLVSAIQGKSQQNTQGLVKDANYYR